MEKHGEMTTTAEGYEPEDLDKVGCQAYTMLVITEGYKKRMLEWQDLVRSHLDMDIIPRQWDPEMLLKAERLSLMEEVQKYKDIDLKTKERMTRFAELRSHDEFEAMSSFVSRKRDQDRT